jgi:hypothetical protein
MNSIERDAKRLAELIADGGVSEKDFPDLILCGIRSEVVDFYLTHVKSKEAKMTADVFQLIDKLTTAVSFKFKDDATSPGVTISKLRHGYYCSVVRYAKVQGAVQKKQVVCKAEASTLEDAVKGVVGAFLKVAQPTPDPLQELDKLANA